MDDNAAQTEALARKQADRWRDNPYYDDAERHMQRHWDSIIMPMIQDADFESVLEIAAGHGRNSEYLLPKCGSLTLLDVNQENIDFCRQRFAGRDEKIRYLVNNGVSLDAIPVGSISFVYCYDSMVHFHSDVVRGYLAEIRRVLKPGGRAFLHHSNSTANPGGLDISKHVQGRNFMSKEMFAHFSILEGLEVIESKVLDWGGAKSLDCITLLSNPNT